MLESGAAVTLIQMTDRALDRVPESMMRRSVIAINKRLSK